MGNGHEKEMKEQAKQIKQQKNEISDLKNKIDILQNSNKNASKEQNEFNNSFREYLEYQKSKEEEDRKKDREIQKQLLEQNRKTQLENSKLLTNVFEKMQKLEQERLEQDKKDRERREKLEREARKKEEEFREKMYEQQKKKEEYFEKMLSQIREDAVKKEKELEKKNKEMIEALEKQKKDFENQIKNETDKFKKELLEKEKKKLEEQIKKEEEAQKDFKNQSEELIQKKIEEFSSEFEKREEEFCREEISKFDLKKIEELIEQLNKSENLDKKVLSLLTIYSKDYSNNNQNKGIDHLNIVLIGPTGVGKSTLINSILELPDDKKAKTQSVDPCTMGEPEFYESNYIPFLRLADSRGIEKSQYGVEAVVKSTEDFVNSQIKLKDPDKFVHCIWYCITGSRFEGVEADSLKRLAALYDNNKLPIIVVYTQAQRTDYCSGIKQKVENLGYNLGWVEVIAKEIEIETGRDPPKTIVPKKGLSELKKISIEKAKGAVSSACYSAIKKNIREGVSEKLKKTTEQIKKYLQEKTEEKINKLTERSEISIMTDTITVIIVEIIKLYLSGGGDGDAISSEGYNYIKKFLDDFFTESLKCYLECFKSIINKSAEKYSDQLVQLQIQIGNKHNGNLKILKNKNEFELDLRGRVLNKLDSKAKLFCMKNAAKFISEPVREYFSKFIDRKYDEMINNNEDVQKIFQEEAEKNFEKLDKMINNTNSENKQ